MREKGRAREEGRGGKSEGHLHTEIAETFHQHRRRLFNPPLRGVTPRLHHALDPIVELFQLDKLPLVLVLGDRMVEVAVQLPETPHRALRQCHCVRTNSVLAEHASRILHQHTSLWHRALQGYMHTLAGTAPLV
jgi:hypothetical protein